MPSIADTISAHRPDFSPYETLYQHLHSHPELSFKEHNTAKTIISHLPSDFTVTKDIGQTGIAAVLHNGTGPTVLLRADMDALPVQEQTGLSYASTVRMQDLDGHEQPVMHACGHDMHVASLVAASHLLHAARSSWSGTLVLIFQPAEEKGQGARAMVDAGLYTTHQIPVPDVVLGGHVGAFPTGTVASRPGLLMGAADTFKITLYGRGAHASAPHKALDPVLSAANATVRLQSLVSRSLDPLARGGVVTVASIQAGYGENVIPPLAEMKVDIRSSDDGMRKTLVDGVHRIVKAEAQAAEMDKEPKFERLRDFPITYNDPEAVERLGTAMKAHFGEQWSDDAPIVGASEDVSILASAVGKPCVFWWYGGYSAEYLKKMEAEGKEHEVPYNHSPFFAPVIQPTLRTAVDAYAVAALTWLGKGG
jgi:amidohydrolase